MEALNYLIDVANCDLTMPNNDGLKPIHAAAQAGHTSIVKVIKLIIINVLRNNLYLYSSSLKKLG